MLILAKVAFTAFKRIDVNLGQYMWHFGQVLALPTEADCMLWYHIYVAAALKAVSSGKLIAVRDEQL